MNRKASQEAHTLMVISTHRLTRIVSAASMVAALAILSPTVLAEDEALPKGADVVDQGVESSGGKAAIAKLKNRIAKGTLEFAGMGVKGPTTVYAARPNKQYFLFESEGMGKIEAGTDGEVAWEANAMTGPQIKKGAEKALMLRDAIFDGDVKWRDSYKSAECVGIEEVGEASCYKVVMTPNEGKPETRYYDKKTHLLVKKALTIDNQMGEIALAATVSDYREIDGLLIPYKLEQVIANGMQTMIFVTESIEHNVDIAKDRFDLPEQIQELLKAESKPKADTKDESNKEE